MEIEHKCTGVTGFKVLDEAEGIVETYISVTGLQDNVKDIILPGAYEKSLAVRTPKGVWHHQWSESISRTEDIKELLPGDSSLPDVLPNKEPWPKDAGALLVKTRFNLQTQRGREAYEDVKFFGDEQEWSIGYNVPVGGATIDSKTGVRKISTLDLYEYSPVLFGAMPAARTASVKDAQLAYKALNTKDVNEFMLETKMFLDDMEEKVKVRKPKFDPNVDAADLAEDEADGGADEATEDENETTPNNPVNNKKKRKSVFDWDEEMETKSFFSAAQIGSIQGAIDALDELLVKSVSTDTTSTTDSASGTGGGGSLSDFVSELFPDDDQLAASAKDFDDALDAGDGDAMEDAGDPILTAVEEAIENGGDASKFSTLTDYLVSSFDEVGEGPDSDNADGSEKPEQTETDESLNTEANASKSLGFVADYDMTYQFKRDFNPDKRVSLAKKGHALPDGSFPIENTDDLTNAIKACGRAKDKNTAMAHIKKRAKELKAEKMLPESWKADGIETETKTISMDEVMSALESV